MKYRPGDDHLPPNIASQIKRLATASEYLGWEFVEADDDANSVVLAFNATDRVCNKYGALQGGMISAMLDDVLSAASGLSLAWGEINPTLEMKTSFIANGKPGRLLGKGKLVKRGRSIGFVEASLYNEDGSLVATASSTHTYVVFKKKDAK